MINVNKYTKTDGTKVRSHNRKEPDFPELRKIDTSKIDFDRKRKVSSSKYIVDYHPDKDMGSEIHVNSKEELKNNLKSMHDKFMSMSWEFEPVIYNSERKDITNRKDIREIIIDVIARKSSEAQMKESINKGSKYIEDNLKISTMKQIKILEERFKNGEDTKSIYSKNGEYLPERKKLHDKIINKILSQDTITKNPDLYIFGGVPASGKSQLEGFVKEKCVVINNDHIKKELAKVNPSPIKKYMLLHAPILHEESSDIEEKLVAKALKQKKDVILDRTLGSFDKNLKLVKKFKSKGYDITTLGTQLHPHEAINRASKRFVKGGRYVPLALIKAKGNKINKNVLRMASQDFNERKIIIDTSVRPSKVIIDKKN